MYMNHSSELVEIRAKILVFEKEKINTFEQKKRKTEAQKNDLMNHLKVFFFFLIH